MVSFRSFSLFLPVLASTVTGFRLPISSRFLSNAVSSSMSPEVDGGTGTVERTSVFVGNLPIDAPEAELRSFFEERVGTSFTNLRIPMDRKTGGPRGFVYLDFADQSSAENAVASLAGSSCRERPVKVDLADPARKNDSPRPVRALKENQYPQENSIYVGNLDFETTESELKSLCDEMLGEGVVAKIRLAIDRDTGRARGFAHIDFRDADVAKTAVETMNAANVRGRAIRVNIAQRKEDRVVVPRTQSFTRSPSGERPGRQFDNHSVFIGNLAWDMTPALVEEMLNDVLGPGLHKRVRLATDRETGRSRGFGHIDFIDQESCQRAISELNGMEVLGRPLRVDSAQRKEESSGERSGGRGRGGGSTERKYDNETPENYGSW